MADLGETHRDADVVRVVEVFGDDVVLDVLWERGEEGPIRQCLRRLVSSPTAEGRQPVCSTCKPSQDVSKGRGRSLLRQSKTWYVYTTSKEIRHAL